MYKTLYNDSSGRFMPSTLNRLPPMDEESEETPSSSRRNLLKTTGAVAAGLGITGVVPLDAAASTKAFEYNEEIYRRAYNDYISIGDRVYLYDSEYKPYLDEYWHTFIVNTCALAYDTNGDQTTAISNHGWYWAKEHGVDEIAEQEGSGYPGTDPEPPEDLEESTPFGNHVERAIDLAIDAASIAYVPAGIADYVITQVDDAYNDQRTWYRADQYESEIEQQAYFVVKTERESRFHLKTQIENVEKNWTFETYKDLVFEPNG